METDTVFLLHYGFQLVLFVAHAVCPGVDEPQLGLLGVKSSNFYMVILRCFCGF